MTENDNYHSQLVPNNGGNLSQDLLPEDDSHWWEIISPTQLFTEWQLPPPPPLQTVVNDDNRRQKKGKCRGNRKLQHFKRKCRAHGLTEDQIARLIHERDGHQISEQSSMIERQQ